MSLNLRIIACLDVHAGRVVKGIQFESLRDAGDPVAMSEIYSASGIDELVFLDITASVEKRSIFLNMIRDISQKIFIPLTVGGGIKTVQDVKQLLQSGSDKVALNTVAVENSNIISEASLYFGSQCIVASIDAKRSLSFEKDHKWDVYIYGGRKKTGLDVIKWSRRVEALGAGEILLTSIDADGEKNGYDILLIQEVSEAVSIPVVASGGAGNVQHFYDAWMSGANAGLAASIFHDDKLSIKYLKQRLKKMGVPIR